MPTTTKLTSLASYGIKNASVLHNLSPKDLQKIALEKKMGTLADSGALVINTGEFTGRSPQDRFIVKDETTKDQVWWGTTNIPFKPSAFDALYKKLVDYLSEKEVFVHDCYACASPDYRTNIRVISQYPWSCLFAYNMFLRISEQEKAGFKEQWLVINVPRFMANPKEDETRQHNFSIINFSKKIILIGGTGYTGEIKKGVFSALNFVLPTQHNTFPMHCAANIGKQGDTAIYFGLSGTGKTTLSADPNRKLIGDDEHGWTTQNTIFNFEGGCYAKTINLSEEKEPDIFNAIKEGALLENVIINNNKVDFNDASITENTRVSYPIFHINNIQTPSVGQSPKNIFFLTADAFGVLPPISRLTPGQAAYHFISGYTAKVAGTEAGINEPLPSFSACFGEPFMPLHPTKYAEMLIDKIQTNKVNVWLVNTGWTGGPYGVGHRIKLKYTRAMIAAALNGDLGDYSYETYHIHSIFGVAQPRTCPGVPAQVLSPRQTWNNDTGYYKQAKKLAKAFRDNFKKFEAFANAEILAGAPPFSE